MMEAQAEIFRLWRAGEVRPPVTQTFAFEDLPSALVRIEEGRIRGKAAILVRDQA